MPKGVSRLKHPELYGKVIEENLGIKVPTAIPIEAIAEVSQVNQLVDLITTLAQSVQKLSEEVKEIKNNTIQVQPATPSTPATPATPSNFFTTMPSELLSVAKEVLGEKFSFECIPEKDKPFFDFIVIVPPEYSTLKEGQDRRSKMISNAIGVDGVKKWCELVKENVIRTMGKQLINA